MTAIINRERGFKLGIHLFLSLFLLFFTLGCGSSSSSSKQEPSTTTQTISGYVVDGYIAGATVCIDLNTNDTCDADEPTTTTNEDGFYTLETTLVGDDFTLLAYGGVDTATEKEQLQPYRALVSLQKKEVLQSNVTPLTCIAHGLYKQKSAEDSNYSYEDAKAELATALDLSPEDITADPMQSNTLFATTQRIAQTSSLLEVLLADPDTTDGCSLGSSVALFAIHTLAQDLGIQIDQELQTALENLEEEILDLLNNTDSTQTRADLQRDLYTNIQELKAKIQSSEPYAIGALMSVEPMPEPEPEPAVTYSWSTGSWSTCSGPCGTDNATQSRTVTCIASTGESVADSMCTEPKPATTQACTASICPPPITYSWIVGDWGVCSGDCGENNATQSRTVTCIASTGESVADSMCTEPKPATTQACTASECPVNNAPVIHTDFQDLVLQQNSGTTNYELNVSDADGDELTLSVVSSDTSIITVEPNWINPLKLPDYEDQTLDFNLITVANAFGVVTITITVDDSEANATTSFDVNVKELIIPPVKKTGQTKSYNTYALEVTDGSLKDDGFYQKGVDHNYTRDDTNNIVTDHVTGLMWQDDANVSSVEKRWLTNENYTTCSNDTNSPACYDTSGDTAATYCSELTLGGYTDWRLPTVEELRGIADYGKTIPAIDTTYFQNVTSSHYWSSTTHKDYKSKAWDVNFYYGNDNYAYKSNNNYFVRCVRAGE